MPAVAALAIPAAIGIGKSVVGGVVSSRAAKSAAQLQAEAAARAAAGVNTAVGQVNPEIAASADAASAGVTGAAEAAAQGVQGAADTGIADLSGTREKLAELLAPYLAGGTDAMGKLTELAGQQFSFSQQDPSFQFRMSEGMKALERSAAAKGGLLSGGTMKALTRYSSDLASTEYGNEFNRWNTSRMGSAGILAPIYQGGLEAAGQSSRNEVSLADLINKTRVGAAEYGGRMRTGAAEYAGDMGYGSTLARGRNTIGAAEYAGEAGMQGANAQAGGKLRSARAWTEASNGIFDTAADTWGRFAKKRGWG